MCGIVAYTGPRDAAPILVEGLARLEYRGYDSAGLAVTTVTCGAADGFALDPAAVPGDADLVVIGNPTNPTGALHPAALIRRLTALDQGRLPALVARKYQRMAEDAFAFFRGSNHLFQADFPRGLRHYPKVWLNGDLHLENFGTYRGENRLTYFDIGDFDDGTGACLWDFRAVFSDADGNNQHPVEKRQINVCQISTYTYTDN